MSRSPLPRPAAASPPAATARSLAFVPPYPPPAPYGALPPKDSADLFVETLPPPVLKAAGYAVTSVLLALAASKRYMVRTDPT